MLLNKRIPIGYILNKIKYDLLYVFIVSMLVMLFTSFNEEKLPELPLTIPAFIGTAISILLSFKLNQSYDRWWEARKVWGSIVNDSRSLMIQLKTLPKYQDPLILKTIAYRQIAWCYSLGQSLRGLDPIENLGKYLNEEEIRQVNRHVNKPLAILNLNAQTIKELREKDQLDSFAHIQLDNTLVRLVESQGRAERIKKTIFPVTYRKFLHFIIYLFVITLSISLRDTAGYFEIPLLLLISSAFFLLEKSATHMQDPFENRPTDTSVTAIAQNIEINIRQMIEDENVPEPQVPGEFYVL